MRQLNYSLPISVSSLGLVGVGAQPNVSGYTHTNASYQSVLVNGNYAYVIGTGGNGTGIIGLTLTIFDVTNPAAPVAISYITTGTVRWTSGNSYLNGAYIAGYQNGILYVASSGSVYLYSVDVSNPYSPTNIGYVTGTLATGAVYGVAIAGNYAYMATQNTGLVVANITNPAAMTQTYQEGGTLNKSIGVYVTNGYCYTTNYQTASPWTVRYLKIWSLANPAVPTLLETYTLPAGTKPGEVLVSNNIAYVADLNTNRVYIVDVTIPTSPNYLGAMQASANFNVTNDAVLGNNLLVGNYSYLTSGANATYGGAIDFFDLTNPASPVLVTTLKQGVASSLFTGAYLYNNLLYVANYGVSGAYAASLNIYSTQQSFSPAIDSRNLANVSVQLSATSGASGTFTLQGSDDITGQDGFPGVATNWTNITSPVSVSGTGAYIIPYTDVCYQQLRLSYVNTGAGSISATLKAIGG